MKIMHFYFKLDYSHILLTLNKSFILIIMLDYRDYYIFFFFLMSPELLHTHTKCTVMLPNSGTVFALKMCPWCLTNAVCFGSSLSCISITQSRPKIPLHLYKSTVISCGQLVAHIWQAGAGTAVLSRCRRTGVSALITLWW